MQSQEGYILIQSSPAFYSIYNPITNNIRKNKGTTNSKKNKKKSYQPNLDYCKGNKG